MSLSSVSMTVSSSAMLRCVSSMVLVLSSSCQMFLSDALLCQLVLHRPLLQRLHHLRGPQLPVLSQNVRVELIAHHIEQRGQQRGHQPREVAAGQPPYPQAITTALVALL